MIFYYAAGGGLGHLTRARAVIHTLDIREPVTILTASSFASDKRVVGDAKVINIPQSFASDLQVYRAWLGELFQESLPTKIFLDTFPRGILGEFCDFDFPNHIELFHVARYLRWAEHEEFIRGAMPVFRATYVVESLAVEQESYLNAGSEKLIPLDLIDPPPRPGEEENRFLQKLQESLRQDLRPCWLIIHSGSLDEVAELLAYAGEMSEQEHANPRLILIAPEKIKLSDLENISSLQTADAGSQTSLEHDDFYPATVLFPFAARIITACGFNVMRQTESYKEKHRFIPFARRFDNQFLRAARRKASK
jgi:hypothetical protein